jgi:hypothetical protein
MPSSRALRGEAGQSTVLVLSMLWVMVLFVAVVVNVGQAVNRRIALQIVADAGALTGATEMAVGLNQIAFWNKVIQTTWTGLTAATLGFTPVFPERCTTARSIVGAYHAFRAPAAAAASVINLGYMFRPYTEARRVSEYNIQDLFPGELDRFEFAERDLSPEVGIMPRRNLIPAPTGGQGEFERGVYNLKQVGNGTRPRPFGPNLGAGSRRQWRPVCLGFRTIRVLGRRIRIPVPFRETIPVNVWYEKANPGADHFVWLVTVAPTRALMFDSILGPNAIPEMRAVGVAKPVGGHVGRGESTYVVKMVPAARAMALSYGSYGAINDSSYSGSVTGSLRPVTH